ncbi:hypothetical protein IC232_03315 [Microvirga sp. BT688]|uniref:putative Ig domain-containing protein n=1 Tax=Microvirga sp. TaxID=1873136 RepID=UPI001682133E|nr:putative Ig domain-containing protein [Microvirga sp.]MBD2745718.1 hypothetical protein [Microvirga sp.]
MATLTITPGLPNIAIDPAVFFSNIGAGSVTQVDENTITVSRVGGYTLVIKGITLDYDEEAPYWASGTITSFELVDADLGVLATLSGLSYDVTEFGDMVADNDPYWLMEKLTAGNDTVTGGDGSDYLYTGAGDDVISAAGGDDTIVPGRGNATLDGGAGVDVLSFNDVLFVSTGVNVNLAAGTGTSYSGGSLTLSNIESVVGTFAADTIVGSDADNNLFGSLGNDSMTGGAGNDVIDGDIGNDTLLGGTGNDTIYGGDGNDTVDGGTGDDTLGLSGTLADFSFSFDAEGRLLITEKETGQVDLVSNVEYILAGDTLYTVDNLKDGIDPGTNPGTGGVPFVDQKVNEDTAWSYTIPAGSLTAGATFTITGLDNEPLPSWIVFNAGTWTFSGTPPKDWHGQIGVKVAVDDSDILKDFTFKLTVSAVNDAPTGLNLHNGSVTENAKVGQNAGHLSAKDVDGGDKLKFELVDSADGRFMIDGDKVVVADPAKIDYEQATSHTIKVKVTDLAGVSVTQAFTIEVKDVGKEDSVGGGGRDVLKGGKGGDKLNGGEGDDRLFGGDGLDVLTGGKGKDAFVFNTKANTKTNKDKITDFNVKDDSIYLENSIFTKFGKKGSESSPFKLSKNNFANDKAKDKDDYIVYNKKTGVISYDADGSGKAKAVEVASVTKGLKLNYDDFFAI